MSAAPIPIQPLPSEAICPTCRRPFERGPNPQQVYCGPECQQSRPSRKAIYQRHNARKAGHRGGAAKGDAYRRHRENAGERPLSEARQAPVRPPFVAEFDASVIIGPPRPAPPQFSREGPRAAHPKPFRDDLNAIADHGSPGRLPPRPETGRSRLSTLALL